jgi:transposase
LTIALLCTRRDGLPLWHQIYGGQVPDAKSFSSSLAAFRDSLVQMGQNLDHLTLVYDKGNVSRANQSLVEASGLHYVASVPASSQRPLVAKASPSMQPVSLDDEEQVLDSR